MNILRKLALAVFAAALVVVIQAAPAKAYSNENMIDNAVFDAKDAMNEAQIRAFLQSRPNTCLTRVGAGLGGGNIFDEPMDYFNYGPNKVDAARVIFKAAQYNEINPRVILATLQKEQGMITDSDCISDSPSLNKAMGYACYEGASACPAAWAAGFERQVMKGAWQLAFDRQRAEGNTSWGGNDSINYGGRMTEGNRRRCGSCALIYFDGYSVIGGVNTRMGNGATASLYNYTPHRNQSFPYWFEYFFGSGSTTQPRYSWQYAGQGSNVGSSMVATQKGTWTLSALNTGSTTWVNSGPNPVRLATTRSMDRSSGFCTAGWLGCGRAANLNEPSVAPGQTGTFTFTVQAPVSPGTYNEYFNLVAEGIAWMNDPGLYWGINVSAANLSGSTISNTLPTSIAAQASGSGVITIRNDSNVAWYKDGRNPVNLGTFNPTDRASAFYTTGWLGANRPAAMNEAIVSPGQNASFTVPIKAPANGGAYIESFSLVAEGYRWLNQAVTSTITVTGGSVQPAGVLSSGQSLTANQSMVSADGRYRLVVQGDGNLVLYSPNRPIWWTGTNGKPANRLSVQGDGNLVLYGNTTYYWATWTQNAGNVRLVVQNDGNLVLYNAQDRAVWNTRTAGRI